MFSFSVPTSQGSSFSFTVIPFCGDRILSLGEQCDDGNTLSGDGCSSTCQLESTFVAGINICGDGIALAPEQCDDGNRNNFDGCDRFCTLEVPITPPPNTFIPFQFQDEQGITQTVQVPLQQIASQITTQVEGQFAQDPNAVIPLQIQDTQGITRTLQVPLQQLMPHIPTQVAGQFSEFIPFQYQDEQGNIQTIQFPVSQIPAELIPFIQQQNLPLAANLQALPLQLNLPRSQSVPVGDTGPAALGMMIAGAVAGIGWARRRRRND